VAQEEQTGASDLIRELQEWNTRINEGNAVFTGFISIEPVYCWRCGECPPYFFGNECS
jgi:hypothetical protein